MHYIGEDDDGESWYEQFGEGEYYYPNWWDEQDQEDEEEEKEGEGNVKEPDVGAGGITSQEEEKKVEAAVLASLDDAPKVKEADEVVFTKYPTPRQVRTWKLKAKKAVAEASGRPAPAADRAVWILPPQVLTPEL